MMPEFCKPVTFTYMATLSITSTSYNTNINSLILAGGISHQATTSTIGTKIGTSTTSRYNLGLHPQSDATKV